MTMIGVSGASSRTCGIASRPSPSGNLRSSSTRSYGAAFSRSCTAASVATASTWWPLRNSASQRTNARLSSSSTTRIWSGIGGRHRSRLWKRGQLDDESRGGPAVALDADRAVMRPDDLPGDRESKPGPPRLRREERLEDALLQLERDGGAPVRDHDLHRAVVHKPPNGDLAVAARFQRILDQVGEDLVEKHRVAVNGHERPLHRQGGSAARPRRDQALEELVQEDGLPALRLGMREAQELFDESLLALDALEDAFEVLARAIVLREVCLQEFYESANAGERRSHFVRDPRRHLTEKRELIGPFDLLPDVPLLRRIAQQQHETGTGRSPGLALDRYVEEERSPGPRARLNLVEVKHRRRQLRLTQRVGEGFVAEVDRERTVHAEQRPSAEAREIGPQEGLRCHVEQEKPAGVVHEQHRGRKPCKDVAVRDEAIHREREAPHGRVERPELVRSAIVRDTVGSGHRGLCPLDDGPDPPAPGDAEHEPSEPGETADGDSRREQGVLDVRREAASRRDERPLEIKKSQHARRRGERHDEREHHPQAEHDAISAGGAPGPPPLFPPPPPRPRG